MKQALLIIDIQNDYFDGSMPLVGALEAGANAKLVLESFRKNSQPVVHVQHISMHEGATFFLPNTRGCEIHSLVTPVTGEEVIVKHLPNSFVQTKLLEHLKSMEVTDLVVCGMMTHMCVESGVRAARELGFNVTVIGDACATRDLTFGDRTVKAIDVHTSFLAAMNGIFANVQTTGQYLSSKTDSNSVEH